VSSYLIANKQYCIACAVLYELGKQLSLEDTNTTTSFMSLKNASLDLKKEQIVPGYLLQQIETLIEKLSDQLAS